MGYIQSFIHYNARTVRAVVVITREGKREFFSAIRPAFIEDQQGFDEEIEKYREYLDKNFISWSVYGAVVQHFGSEVPSSIWD